MSRRVRRRFASFARDDEGGAITMLMLVLFIGVLLLTGISLDLARHESERADLQSAVDRGVLQAASLRNSTIDEDKVRKAIERFVDTRTLSESDTTVALGNVTLTPGERSIEVAAGFPMPTSFMRLAGVGSLEVGAYSSAVERDPNIELSLVLDMSGSMCQPCTKLEALKTAAQSFITEVVGPNTGKKVSVNLIRYDWHVNVGPWMFNRMANTPRDPAKGSCYQIKIEDDLEDNPGTIPNQSAGETRGQIGDAWFINDFGTITGHKFTNVCPPDSAAILYLEHDATKLNQAINAMSTNNGSTATYLAMQWGLALLNPASQPVVAEMAASDDVMVAGSGGGMVFPPELVDDAFASRPASWTDHLTNKYLVLFTDGNLNVQGDFYTEFGDSPPSQAEAEQVFLDQCQHAKDNDIVVFTIAFEAPPSAEDDMRDCATNNSFYFEADSGNIDEVFDKIARNIQVLKLTN